MRWQSVVQKLLWTFSNVYYKYEIVATYWWKKNFLFGIFLEFLIQLVCFKHVWTKKSDEKMSHWLVLFTSVRPRNYFVEVVETFFFATLARNAFKLVLLKVLYCPLVGWQLILSTLQSICQVGQQPWFVPLNDLYNRVGSLEFVCFSLSLSRISAALCNKNSGQFSEVQTNLRCLQFNTGRGNCPFVFILALVS